MALARPSACCPPMSPPARNDPCRRGVSIGGGVTEQRATGHLCTTVTPGQDRQVPCHGHPHVSFGSCVCKLVEVVGERLQEQLFMRYKTSLVAGIHRSIGNSSAISLDKVPLVHKYDGRDAAIARHVGPDAAIARSAAQYRGFYAPHHAACRRRLCLCPKVRHRKAELPDMGKRICGEVCCIGSSFVSRGTRSTA